MNIDCHIPCLGYLLLLHTYKNDYLANTGGSSLYRFYSFTLHLFLRIRKGKKRKEEKERDRRLFTKYGVFPVLEPVHYAKRR